MDILAEEKEPGLEKLSIEISLSYADILLSIPSIKS